MKKSLIQAYLEENCGYWGVSVLEFDIQGNDIHVHITSDYQSHELDIEMYDVMEFIWDKMVEGKA